MVPDQDPIRLRHMRDAAREAIDLTRDRVRGDLDRERLLNLALVRLMEIVGEAAARVSAGLRADHTEIPWPLVVGLRWAVIEVDLPPLVAALGRLIAEGDQSPGSE